MTYLDVFGITDGYVCIYFASSPNMIDGETLSRPCIKSWLGGNNIECCECLSDLAQFPSAFLPFVATVEWIKKITRLQAINMWWNVAQSMPQKNYCAGKKRIL